MPPRTITPPQQIYPQPSGKKRWILWPLVAVLVAVAAAYGGWYYANQQQSNDRTVSVTGTATVKAEPDEFVFSPQYEFENADRNAALEALSKKSDEIVSELKKRGVDGSKIKSNAADYKQGLYFPERTQTSTTYTLVLTVTASSKELAQKVQDYLVTTTPSGSVTPYSSFSETKSKQLEASAREQAQKDARSKAEQSAKNVGFKLGKVQSIADGPGFGDVIPMRGAVDMGASTDSAAPQLAVQPGENELHYEIKVIYYIR